MLRQITAAAIVLLTTCSATAGTVITQWNFNTVNVPPATNLGTTVASTGIGTINRVGGLQVAGSGEFANANNNLGSSDPTASDDSSWTLSNFHLQGAGNKSRGIQFVVSTLGMENISVSWDQRNSATAVNTAVLQYLDTSSNTFVEVASYVSNNANWFNGRTYDFSSLPVLNNNTTATFRILAAFAAGTTPGQYVATNSGSTYSEFGTWQFDMVTVSGNAIPVTIVPLPPAALAGLSLLACLPLAKTLRRKA